MWDLPGGGREGGEGPEACVLREIAEELGLRLPPDRLERRWVLPSIVYPDRRAWFFRGRLTDAEVAGVRFGGEGQTWQMMPVAEFLRRADAVPAMQDRVRMALAD
jgi:8-oxo-dGTP diphosphatase